MRVAVASSDGIVVNQHFGRADTFYIYDLEEEIKLVEKRRGRPFCHGGEHDEQDLQDAVDLLTDCRKVFVLQIGRGAELSLREKDIEPVISRDFINDALKACLDINR